MLSLDDMPDGGDTELYSYTINSLAGGATDARNFDITLPASGVDDQYHLIMQVDNTFAVEESEENNNESMLF